jgi:hypothetical protein
MRTAGTWAPLVDGAWVQAGGASGQGTGAGVFPSLLLWGTTQANNGKGYNTDASGPNRQYEISGGSNTRSVPLNSIPTIARNDVIYREFRFDGQAPGAQAKEEYSVDEIRVYLVPNVSPNNAISNFLVAGEAGPRPALTASAAAIAKPVWDMNAGIGFPATAVALNHYLLTNSALSSGQGSDDLRLLVPNSRFLAQIPQADIQACAYDGFDYSAGGTNALDSDCPWLIYFVSAHGYNSTKDSGNSEWSVAFRPVLLVSKTAVGTFDREYDWTVTKEVNPDAFDLFRGDAGTASYTLTLTKIGPFDTNHRVEGTITMENDSDETITVKEIKDILELDGLEPIVIDFDDLDCTGIATLPHAIPAGETRTCTYSIPVDIDGGLPEGVNNATVEAVDPRDPFGAELSVAGFGGVEWSDEPA